MRTMVVSTLAASTMASKTWRVDVDKEDGGHEHASDCDSELAATTMLVVFGM